MAKIVEILKMTFCINGHIFPKTPIVPERGLYKIVSIKSHRILSSYFYYFYVEWNLARDLKQNYE